MRYFVACVNFIAKVNTNYVTVPVLISVLIVCRVTGSMRARRCTGAKVDLILNY